MYKYLVFVICTIVGVSADFNKIMDEALALANFEIGLKGLSKMPLPDIKYGFNDKIGFINLGLGVNLNKGWIRNLATIERKGNVSFPLGNDSTITLDAVMGLKDLEVHFDDFVMDLLLFKLHQNVSVKVKNNAVSFELAVVAKGTNCSTQVNKFEIKDFSGVDVKFYPDSLFHKFKDIVDSAVANIAAPILKHIINPRLKPVFNNVLRKIDVCKLIPVPHW